MPNESLYNQFFDKFLLPMFKPPVLAKTLAKKRPDVAAIIMGRLSTDKGLKVLEHWSPGVCTIILEQMGDKSHKLIEGMAPPEKAHLLTSLSQNIIKNFSKNLTADDLESMVDYWSDEDLRNLTLRLSPETAAMLLPLMKEDSIVFVLKDMKPWIQKSLVENLPPERKAILVDKFEFSIAIELMTRWDENLQSDIMGMLSAERQKEIFQVLNAKTIASILQFWEIDKVAPVLMGLDFDQQRHTLFRLPKEMQIVFFPQFERDQRVMILNGVEAPDAIILCGTVSEEDSEELMRLIDDDQAAGIRMSQLMND
jgi:Mg/Co/Ni transporter MgtE